MPIVNTIEGRLLCASVCTYSINATGQLIESNCQQYYDAVGFTSAPTIFIAGDDEINACLVGTIQGSASAGGPAVVLAFRGTLPPTDPFTLPELLDWFNDFNAAPVAAPGITGMVHSGFWSSLMSLWPSVLAEVKTQMGSGTASLPLYITGHSKGGALASLAAAQCAEVEGITPLAVYTYASPMTGDSTFAGAYNALGFPDIRYEYTDDIVPHLPPSPLIADLFSPIPVIGPYFKKEAQWNYDAVGTLRFINWSGQIVGDSISLSWQRFTSLFELMLELDFEQIAHDHAGACGGGYMTYICPTGVCAPTAIVPETMAEAGSESGSPLDRWRAARMKHLGRGV